MAASSSSAGTTSRIVPSALSFNAFCALFKKNVEIVDVVPHGLYSTSIVCKAVTAADDVEVQLELDVNYEYIRRAATTLKLLNDADRTREMTAVPVFLNFFCISRDSIKSEARVPLLREALVQGGNPRNKIPAVGATNVNLKQLLLTHSVNARFGLYILITEHRSSGTVEEALQYLDDEQIMVNTNAKNLYTFIGHAFKQIQLLQRHKVIHNALCAPKISTQTILAGSTRNSAIVSYNSVEIAAEKSLCVNLRQVASGFSFESIFVNFRHACSYDQGLLPYKCEHSSKGQDAVDVATIMDMLLKKEKPSVWQLMHASLEKIIREAETPASIEHYIAEIQSDLNRVEMNRLIAQRKRLGLSTGKGNALEGLRNGRQIEDYDDESI